MADRATKRLAVSLVEIADDAIQALSEIEEIEEPCADTALQIQVLRAAINKL